MAAEITADYRDRELTVIAVLTGSLMFMSDLPRRIPLHLKLDCLSVVSYRGKAQTSGQVIFKNSGLPDVADRDVLVLDDILDTGHTLAVVCEKLEMAKPRSLRGVCCQAKGNSGRGMLMRITSALKSRMNSLLVSVSISWSAIAIFPTSVC